MPPVKTESTDLQVFNLDNLNPALLPELITFKESQLKVVLDNPFVAIIDVTTRDLAKKYRTARRTARTDLEKQDKLISSKFNDAKTKAKVYISELITYTQPGEVEQQKEIDRDEAELEEKRQEKVLLEQKRIDSINKEIESFVFGWKDTFNFMSLETVEEISANFLESYTSFDATVLQEFEDLFPNKVEELTQYLSEKKSSLVSAENAKLESVRLEQVATDLRLEKEKLEALVKIAEEAELKAKKEREDFESEKLAFQLEVSKKAETERLELEAKRLAEEKAIDIEKKIAEEAELKAKKEVELQEARYKKDLEAQLIKEGEKSTKTPVREQLTAWVDSFSIANPSHSNETTVLIEKKFESFKIWAKEQIEKI